MDLNSCRICLETNEEVLHELFSIEDEQNYASKITFCCGIEIAENHIFPQKICLNCISQITSACDVKEKCIETDKFIRQTLQQTLEDPEPPETLVKVEIYEEYEALIDEDEDTGNRNERQHVNQTFESDIKQPSANYRCFICEREFKLIKAKNVHVNVDHANATRCKVCDRYCKKPLALEKHTKSHFVKDYCKLCSICGLSFNKKYTLERHIVQIHSETVPLFICDLCPSWNSKFVANLRRHMATVHLNIKQHRCPYIETCSKKFFTTKDALNFHLIGQHNLIKCSKCSQQFDSEKELADHKTSGRCFARTIIRKNRVKKKVIRNKSDSTGFFCEICNASFAKKSQFSMHNTQKHKCDLTCKHCSKQISSYANLVRHVKTVHEGEKRFSCEICSKKFSQKSTLASHKNTHTADKPFICDKCDFKTGDRSTLIKHRKKLHS